MNKSFIQLLLVHIRSFFREPSILFWAIAFPILMAWVLGIAFSNKNTTARPVTVFVIGEGPLPPLLQGEKVIGQSISNPLKIKFQKATREEANIALKKGIISIYLDQRKDSLIYHYDPSNQDGQLTHLMIERELNAVPVNKSSVEVLTAKGTRYIDFLIPGLIAFGIMNSCLWGISWNLIEFRMKKLLRRMIATPMKKSIFFLSHLCTRIVLSFIESAILFLFARIYFGTEITGSFIGLFLVYITGVMAFSGIGILTASRTGNSQVGNGLINAVTLPMTILSGIFFNYHNFPEWAIPFIQALPLTMLADAIRSLFIEAAGIKDVLIPIAALGTTGLISFILGLKLFKWY